MNRRHAFSLLPFLATGAAVATPWTSTLRVPIRVEARGEVYGTAMTGVECGGHPLNSSEGRIGTIYYGTCKCGASSKEVEV